jgi:hypothetical protein
MELIRSVSMNSLQSLSETLSNMVDFSPNVGVMEELSHVDTARSKQSSNEARARARARKGSASNRHSNDRTHDGGARPRRKRKHLNANNANVDTARSNNNTAAVVDTSRSRQSRQSIESRGSQESRGGGDGAGTTMRRRTNARNRESRLPQGPETPHRPSPRLQDNGVNNESSINLMMLLDLAGFRTGLQRTNSGNFFNVPSLFYGNVFDNGNNNDSLAALAAKSTSRSQEEVEEEYDEKDDEEEYNEEYDDQYSEEEIIYLNTSRSGEHPGQGMYCSDDEDDNEDIDGDLSDGETSYSSSCITIHSDMNFGISRKGADEFNSDLPISPMSPPRQVPRLNGIQPAKISGKNGSARISGRGSGRPSSARTSGKGGALPNLNPALKISPRKYSPRDDAGPRSSSRAPPRSSARAPSSRTRPNALSPNGRAARHDVHLSPPRSGTRRNPSPNSPTRQPLSRPVSMRSQLPHMSLPRLRGTNKDATLAEKLQLLAAGGLTDPSIIDRITKFNNMISTKEAYELKKKAIICYKYATDSSFLRDSAPDEMWEMIRRREAWAQGTRLMATVSAVQLLLCVVVLLTANQPIDKATMFVAALYLVTMICVNRLEVTGDVYRLLIEFYSKYFGSSLLMKCAGILLGILFIPVWALLFSTTFVLDLVCGKINNISYGEFLNIIINTIVVFTGFSVGLRSGNAINAVQTFAGFSFIGDMDEQVMRLFEVDLSALTYHKEGPGKQRKILAIRVGVYIIVPLLAIAFVYMTVVNECVWFCEDQ